MEKNTDKVYTPSERKYLEQNPKNFKSYSKKDYTKMPDPVQDPIVCQNIICPEFDYTSNELLTDQSDDKQP